MGNSLRLPLAWVLFPGWLDVAVVLILYLARTHFRIEGIGLLITVVVTGLLRYSIVILRVGFIDFSSRNWYIKQVLIFLVALSLLFLYDQSTFTWLLSAYYAEMMFIELVISILKRVLKK